MKPLFTAAAACLIGGCAGLNEKIDASRQDRCQRPGPYKEGLQRGLARRPRPPV